MSDFYPRIFSCPPPASLTATPLTTVYPHSWLITKQWAGSARAVLRIQYILECSTYQNNCVNSMEMVCCREDCALIEPRSYWGTRRTVFALSLGRNLALGGPCTVWYTQCVDGKVLWTLTRHPLRADLKKENPTIVSLYNGVNQIQWEIKPLRMSDWYL